MDDLDRLRDAFDTLGIDPDEIDIFDDYSLVLRLRAAAGALSIVTEIEGPLVTPNTPPGTEITHPELSGRYWLLGHRRIFGGFLVESESGEIMTRNYSRGWREVKRPDPVPVEPGQWRAMPVRVGSPGLGGDFYVKGGRDHVTGRVHRSEVELWPVIPPPEGTDG